MDINKSLLKKILDCNYKFKQKIKYKLKILSYIKTILKNRYFNEIVVF